MSQVDLKVIVEFGCPMMKLCAEMANSRVGSRPGIFVAKGPT